VINLSKQFELHYSSGITKKVITMQNSTTKIQELNSKFTAGDITESEFMFLVKQNADRFHQKALDQTGIRPLPSRMGVAKKVSRRFLSV